MCCLSLGPRDQDLGRNQESAAQWTGPLESPHDFFFLTSDIYLIFIFLSFHCGQGNMAELQTQPSHLDVHIQVSPFLLHCPPP